MPTHIFLRQPGQTTACTSTEPIEASDSSTRHSIPHTAEFRRTSVGCGSRDTNFNKCNSGTRRHAYSSRVQASALIGGRTLINARSDKHTRNGSISEKQNDYAESSVGNFFFRDHQVHVHGHRCIRAERPLASSLQEQVMKRPHSHPRTPIRWSATSSRTEGCEFWWITFFIRTSKLVVSFGCAQISRPF